ncbi:MAG: hypothetical protein V8Q43_03940 [Christensenellaceae bacterium]
MKKKWIVVGVFFLLCAAAGAYAAVQAPDISLEAQPADAADGEYIALSARADLPVSVSALRACAGRDEDMPAAYVGSTRQELHEQVAPDSITQFSKGEVVLTRRLNTYCPAHYVAYLEEGEMAIYQNLLGSEETERVLTFGLRAEALSLAEEQALSRGKVFSSLEAAQAYAAKAVSGAAAG